MSICNTVVSAKINSWYFNTSIICYACAPNINSWFSHQLLPSRVSYKGARSSKACITCDSYEQTLHGTYGCRKCSNNHALRTVTARSGSPLWGRQTGWCSRNPGLWPYGPLSLLPNLGDSSFLLLIWKWALLANWIWSVIAFFKHLKCLDIAFIAKLA